jgi:hypothetical protein
MALFGLGNFGEGFVTGLAESASEAIQKDMDAVRARIEKLSDFQANKIIKDQEEREEEIRDAMKQLKRASKVFGSDPNAKKYAAAILEREGGIEGLNEVVARFKAAKRDNPALNLGSYFAQSSEELPDLSFREIASAAVPRRTATAVELPEDLAAGGAGTLLSNIGLDQKISQRVSRDVAEQTAAAGIVPTADIDIVLPSLAFNDEQFLLDTSSVQEGMRYLERQRALESNTPERNAEIDTLYADKIKYAAESGADIDAMNGIENQLSRLDITMNPETGMAEGVDASKYDQLQAQKRELQFKMDMANAGTDKKKQLLVQASYARSLGNTDEAIQLQRQADDLDGTPTFKTTIERAERDLRNLDPASPTYEDDRQKLIDIIKNTKAEQKQLQEETGIIDISTQDVAQLQTNIFTNFRNSLTFSPLLDRLKFVAGVPDWDHYVRSLGEDKLALAKVEYGRLFTQAVDMYGTSGITDTKSKAVYKVLTEQLIKQGSYLPLSERGADTGTDTGEEAVVTMPDVLGTVADDVTAEAVSASLKKYPDSDAGMDAYIAAEKDGDTPLEEHVLILKSLGYGEDFITGVKTGLAKAVPDPETVKRQEDLEKAIQIIDDTSGFARKEIRTISKQMGISTEAATELHTSALALQKQRDLDEKESVDDDSVTRLANILRNTDDIDQWNRVAAKYMEETGRDMEATKKAFPPPAKKLNRGGLMARQ